MFINIPVFVVHYKKLEDRKKYLDTALKMIGFTNINWFEDIERDTITQEQLDLYKYDEDRWYELNSLWKQYDSVPRTLTKPEIACAVTHISIYKYIMDNNIEKAIIFEDDAILLKDFSKNFKRVLDELDPDFDLCFMTNAFGWNVDNYKFGYLGSLNKNTYSPDKSVYKMPCGKCTDSYIISKKGASLLYKNIIPFCLPIDWCHNPIFIKNNMNIYWTEPALSHQGSEDVYKSSVGRIEQPIESLKSSYQVIVDDPVETIVRYSEIQGEENSTKYASLELTSTERLNELTSRIKTYSNFILMKIHDGEARSMISLTESDHNCDGCYYYKGLGLDIIMAYIYALKKNNAYILKWHSHTYKIIDKIEEDNSKLYNSDRKFIFGDLLTHKLESSENSYTIDGLSFKSEQIDFFRTIKFSSRKKIYISNIDMIRAVVPLLNIDYGFIIPEKNSYLQKDIIIENLKNMMVKLDQKNIILMFSGGMFAKVLIHRISELFPDNTYFCLGSTFDGLIKGSRDFNGTELYRDVLLKCYT